MAIRDERSNLPPRLVTPEELERFLKVYESELGLLSYQKAALRQGLAMAREALDAAVPHGPEQWIPYEIRQEVYKRAAGWCEYCLGKVERRGNTRLPTDAEVDHMVARIPLLQFGAIFPLIHDRANLVLACGRCNGEKMTDSLPPDRLMRMWETVGIDGTTDTAQLLLFYSTILTSRSFRIRRFEEPKARDLQSILKRMEAGYRRLHDTPERRAILERWEQAKAEVARMEPVVWERESASDDNRELYYRAPWQP